MNEIKQLIARARRYTKSAQLLIEDEDYESAVSRMYYAMFYCVEALLLTKKLSFSSHKAVIAAFGQHFVKTGLFPKAMSKTLTKAFEMRQFSDYEYTFMQKNTSITLSEHYEKFIAQQITNGRFSSVSEAVRAGLRLLEEREIRIEALRQALKEGEESGFTDYSLSGMIEELDKESPN